jgi:hypothetical protein
MKVRASVCTSVVFLTLALSASLAHAVKLSPEDQQAVDQRSDEIAANAATATPEETCREIQVNTQEVAGPGADKRRLKAVLRGFKKALRQRIPRTEIAKKCYNCINKQFKTPSNQGVCGANPPTTTTTTLPGSTTTTTDPGPTTTTLPSEGRCPNRVELTLVSGTGNTCTSNADCEIGSCNTTIGRCQTPTELDTGWTGISHDADVTDGVTIAANLNNCGSAPECGQCNVTGLRPDGNICRCAGDNRQVCDRPFAADADDCGGGMCNCYLGSPLSLSAGNTPVCVVNRFAQNITGTANVSTGNGATLVKLRSVVYLGESLTEPCPTCIGDPTPLDGVRGGTCALGANAGASCDADGFNYTFPAPGGGAHSLDCFPANGKNVSGGRTTDQPSADYGLELALGQRHLRLAAQCHAAVPVRPLQRQHVGTVQLGRGMLRHRRGHLRAQRCVRSVARSVRRRLPRHRRRRGTMRRGRTHGYGV